MIVGAPKEIKPGEQRVALTPAGVRALTERGQGAALAMRDIVGEVETEWEQQLGPERFAELRLLLTDLNGHVAGDTTQANDR